MTAVATPKAPGTRATPTRKPARPRRRLVLHLAVAALMVIWAVPTIGLLVSSFRPQSELSTSGWWTAFAPPYQFTMENYRDVFQQSGIGEAFVNSLLIAIPATIIPLFVAAFAAYAFSWMEFPGRDVLFVVIVGLLVVPLQTTLIPVLKLFAEWELTGEFLSVWLAHTGYGLPFAVYLLRNFMGSLPRAVFESAYMDGASHVTAFFRIAVPMSVPAFAALAIFQFLFVWNDLLVALIYIGLANSDNLPMTAAIANLVNSLGGGWYLLSAAAFVSMALPLAVFFGLQRYFVRGIVGGAVKG
ncbi:carbohydrate ABC transporter permease [Micromonospora sp. DR5-3]|uniref:carbohydrate ABC transporter permease n=1 Tax=unclassified Micromonospora TaxID=2617518 RepID=UPI0011D692AB|nr:MULTISPECIES: carbohydrate ABC transporter permease [unclassified Micromonospora]MCW3814734.1 carbohydrate ABC transporter permease [Micromonospora sp. DR5-3]TYC23520.1 carbohydrate ABC transporter permease [Micromonospora sp. MP36]